MADSASIARPSPTVIEITPQVEITLDNRAHPYCERTAIAFSLHSATRFDRIVVTHLGFRSWSKGKRGIQHRGDKYTCGILLDPNCGAQITVPPFGLTLENVGDSFLKVNVRMPYGIERCKVTVLQEGDLPRKPKEVDEFIKIEDIWYITATINCLQTIRIEEIQKVKNA